MSRPRAAVDLVAEAQAAVAVDAVTSHEPNAALIRDWLASLSEDDLLKHTVTVCDVLTGLLVLMAVLSPAGGALAITAAAADALLRLVRPMLEALDGQQRQNPEA